MKKFVLPLVAVAFLGACADGAGPESSESTTESSSVSIKFGVAGSAASPSSMASFSVAGGAATDDPSHIDGSNGDLDITAIWIIVEEFELEPVEHDCTDALGADVHCPKFEERFFFITLPLNGDFTTVTTDDIPVGNYDELEIEVDNVHVHEDDSPEDVLLIGALFDKIAMELPGVVWPEKASMLVIGTFTPTDGPLENFETFFEAEIEIELEFDDPLVVTDGGPASDIIVMLMLDRWFKSGDAVLNLADSKFQDHDELVEFELELEDGFELEIEIHHN